MTDDASQLPTVRASDAEREAVVVRLQTAVGEGRLDLEEFAQRADAAYASTTTTELHRLTADLPVVPVEMVGERTRERLSSFLGDVRLTASDGVPWRITTGIGDIRLDLRQLRTSEKRIELVLGTVIGDVEVIVAEGVQAELHGRTVIGDRRTELAPVPRIAGTPLVVVRARAVIGDLRLRSLPPGASASRWQALLERLAGRPPVVPPPVVPPLPPLR